MQWVLPNPSLIVWYNLIIKKMADSLFWLKVRLIHNCIVEYFVQIHLILLSQTFTEKRSLNFLLATVLKILQVLNFCCLIDYKKIPCSFNEQNIYNNVKLYNNPPYKMFFQEIRFDMVLCWINLYSYTCR